MPSKHHFTLCALMSLIPISATGTAGISQADSDRFAECAAGLNPTVAVALRTEFETRGGSFISGSEIQEKGASHFRFGDVAGEQAVELYNRYVSCVELYAVRFLPRESYAVRFLPRESVAGAVSIDDVSRMLPPSDVPLALDLVVRNTTASTIALTSARFDFNEHLAGFAQSVLTVSGVYVVSLEDSRALVQSRVGTQEATAWYPSAGGQHLIVTSPISQVLTPNEADRFRVYFTGAVPAILESVTVTLTYNGDKYVRSSRIDLGQ